MTKGADADDRQNFSRLDELNTDFDNVDEDDTDDVRTAKAEAALGDLVQKITQKTPASEKQKHSIPWKV